MSWKLQKFPWKLMENFHHGWNLQFPSNVPDGMPSDVPWNSMALINNAMEIHFSDGNCGLFFRWNARWN